MAYPVGIFRKKFGVGEGGEGVFKKVFVLTMCVHTGTSVSLLHPSRHHQYWPPQAGALRLVQLEG